MSSSGVICYYRWPLFVCITSSLRWCEKHLDDFVLMPLYRGPKQKSQASLSNPQRRTTLCLKPREVSHFSFTCGYSNWQGKAATEVWVEIFIKTPWERRWPSLPLPFRVQMSIPPYTRLQKLVSSLLLPTRGEHVFAGVFVCVHRRGGCSEPCPPALKPREGNRPFSCGCSPCTHHARAGIIPGIAISNSPARPTDSKILRPVIVLLSLGLPRSGVQSWISGEVGESFPPPPAHPELPRLGQEPLRLGFFLQPFSPFPLPRPGEDSTSAFLVACLLLIPCNLSRIKTPLRKNGPGPNTCYANGSKSPGPRGGAVGTRGPPVVQEHPPPATRLHPQSQEGPPVPPPQELKLNFIPPLQCFNSSRLSFLPFKENQNKSHS